MASTGTPLICVVTSGAPVAPGSHVLSVLHKKKIKIKGPKLILKKVSCVRKGVKGREHGHFSIWSLVTAMTKRKNPIL